MDNSEPAQRIPKCMSTLKLDAKKDEKILNLLECISTQNRKFFKNKIFKVIGIGLGYRNPGFPRDFNPCRLDEATGRSYHGFGPASSSTAPHSVIGLALAHSMSLIV